MAARNLKTAVARWRLCRGGVPPWMSDIPPRELLRSATVEDEEEEATVARRAPSEASVLLFPGQGSQRVGMGRELLRYSAARELFRVAERVLGYDLLDLCLNGPPAELDRTVHSQPAIFVCSLAAVEKLHHRQPAVRPGGGRADRGWDRGVARIF